MLAFSTIAGIIAGSILEVAFGKLLFWPGFIIGVASFVIFIGENLYGSGTEQDRNVSPFTYYIQKRSKGEIKLTDREIIEVMLEKVSQLSNKVDKVDLIYDHVVRLTEDLTELKSDVNVLKTDVNMLKTDVKGLKDDVTKLKADVTELKTDVTELKTDVNMLKVDVNGLKGDVTELKADVTELKAAVNRIEGELVTIKEEQQNSFKTLAAMYGQHEFELTKLKRPV